MKDEALKLALEALENHEGNYKLSDAGCDRHDKAINAIKQALAAPTVQEPVGTYGEIFKAMTSLLGSGNQRDQQIYMAMQHKPLYTTPPAAPIPDAIHHTDLSEHPQYIEGWNDCRAEMLKGMKP
jgi:hypothetical protein